MSVLWDKQCHDAAMLLEGWNLFTKFIAEDIFWLRCDLCDYSSVWMSLLDWHKRYSHTEKERKFPCDKCEYSATEYNNLMVHIAAVHDKARNYKWVEHHLAWVSFPGNMIVLGSSQLSESQDRYRVGHLVVQLGWVDFDLGCSTILL